MCFSAQSSIVTFIIGIIGAILCISLGSITDKIIGFFFGFTSLIQGIEYLLWTHQKCDDYNRIISILGMILNNLQPFILGLIILFINTTTPNKNWIIGIMILYLSLIIPYSIQFDKTIQCTIKDDNSKHLKWNWNLMKNSGFVYSIFIFCFCLFALLGFPRFIYGIYFSIIIIISYLTSAYFYTWDFSGVLWCYYSAFFPIIYYLLRITHLIKP